MRIRTLISAFRRRLDARGHYRTTSSWLASLYDAGVRYWRRVPWPGKNKAVPLRLKACADPVLVRLGTADGFVLEEVFIRDVYAPTLALVQADARLVVDLGANVGMTVRLWTEHLPNARVVAVEPASGNLELLGRNAVIGRVSDRVSAYRYFIAGSAGTAFLDESSDECAYKLTRTGGETRTAVPTIDLHSLLQEANAHGSIDLLKVDIEGAEAELFANCRDWIQRVRLAIVELHSPYDLSQLSADLDRNDAELAVVDVRTVFGNQIVTLQRTGAPMSAE